MTLLLLQKKVHDEAMEYAKHNNPEGALAFLLAETLVKHEIKIVQSRIRELEVDRDYWHYHKEAKDRAIKELQEVLGK